MGGAATWCTPVMDHISAPVGTYACKGYILKGCGATNPSGLSPLVKMSAAWEPESRKQPP